MAPIFGYWNIRGRGEEIRLLLIYFGHEFYEATYHLENAQEWFSEKFDLGLDFPNLPYYIDKNFKLTQSAAILEYIADKNNMIPNCRKRRAILRMLHNDITDTRISFGMACMSDDFRKDRAKFLQALPSRLKYYNRYLGRKKWLTGNDINYPDFSLCELLSQLLKFEPSCLDDYPRLADYLYRFENLPELKDYIASREFQRRPCFPPNAKWTGA